MDIWDAGDASKVRKWMIGRVFRVVTAGQIDQSAGNSAGNN
jgi:hypothetical protein